MRAGVAEYRKGNLEGARAAFASAWELEQHTAIAASLADVETRLGQYREAAEHWSFYLRASVTPGPEQKEAQEGLAECRKHVASLRVTTEANANVSVDGHATGSGPPEAEIWLDPGSHMIEVRSASGRPAATERVVLAAGDAKQITLLPAAAGAASASPNPAVAPVAPVVSSPPASVQGADESGVSTRSTVVITGSALTVVAGVVGVVFGLKAQRVSDDAKALTSQINGESTNDALVRANRACNPPSGEPSVECGSLAEKVDAARGARTTSQVAFVAAGTLGIGTVAALLFWPGPKAREARGLVVSPWQAGKSYGLFAEGSF